MGIAAGALAWRAVDLQVLNRDFLRQQGDARSLRVVSVPAHRGMIIDRHGEPLAISTPVESVWANPGQLAAERERWPELARALGITTAKIEQMIAGRLEREFVYLRRHLDPARARQVAELHIPGVALQREYRRYYPTGEVFAHVVGFSNIDDQGQEGVERLYDEWLRGEPGAKRVVKDRLGNVIENVESIRQPRPGRELRLSLDRRIQYLAYRELKSAVQRHNARGGSVVVLDTATGEVLAMVNQPAYNPNNRTNRSGEQLRNRAVTDLFEPGSTVKPFTIAEALASGKYQPNTPVDTSPGYMAIGRYTIRDVNNYGKLDVSGVIQKSSNVGTSRIALSLEPEKLWRTFSRVGFGSPSGSSFPGEASGLLDYPRRWSDVKVATMSYGYGFSATALQLAQAYTVLGNGDGKLRPVSLLPVDREPEALAALPPKVTAQVRRMMEAVTVSGGTAQRAAVTGYRIAGKTGTVHKVGDNGYSADRYRALFAGIAPASRPRLAAVVVIDEPQGREYYGGLVAAPVFSNVMAGALRFLDVPPDDLPSLRGRIAALPPIEAEGTL